MTRRTDFKQLMRVQLQNVGWDIHRYSPKDHRSFQINQCLRHIDAELVFDIGANTGEFAEETRDAGFEGKIVSVEPLSTAHELLEVSAHGDSEWVIHPRCAIGDFNGEIEINISENSVSSSVLPMLDSHSDAAEGSAYIGSEKVPIVRLDDLFKTYVSTKSVNSFFIKIDTQGFEWEVLDGAPEALKNANGILCELSLAPLYEGQKLWRDIIDRLESEGFILWAVLKGFTDYRNGRSLQVDAVFLRRSYA
ncbi:MAG: FkbM family methyltransferase [Gammaproteobacteria bacterium]|jgi:FkbM family methyltransferase